MDFNLAFSHLEHVLHVEFVNSNIALNLFVSPPKIVLTDIVITVFLSNYA